MSVSPDSPAARSSPDEELTSAEIDHAIDTTYRRIPLTEPDTWGDLDSFLSATR